MSVPPPAPANTPKHIPTKRYTVVDAASGAPPPAPTDENQFKAAIDKIEHTQKNLDNKGGIDGLLTKQEIQNAIDAGQFQGAELDFWKDVANNYDKLDINHGDFKGGDNLINAGDLSFNGISYPA